MRKLESLTSFLRHILVSALVAALIVGPGAPAFAGPSDITGGNHKASMTVDAATKTWTVTAPNGSIIHFSNFDIAAGETVNFIQDGPNSRALNRVVSAVPNRSDIDGTLTANGHIYIVNPAGVFFGNGSHVNANGIHAAAGNLSDRDFERGEKTGVDHYTGLRGRVDNAGTITANAVSLVGGKVSNSGDVTAGNGGWIIMAAGRDVLIGRDGAGTGVLLRVEGAASAIFDKNARGVENTGTLTATPATNADGEPVVGGQVTLGAGDLYGTAIFSSGAIEARRVALSADNRGNVALGGSIRTNELDAKFAGNATGELHGVSATAPTTIVANNVSLTATGDRGTVKVGDGLTFRSLDDESLAPKTVTVEQKANLATSSLAGLDLGPNRSATPVKISSTNGAVAIDDRALVNGTKLDVSARTFVDVRGTDALQVDSLKILASSTFSQADLIATGADGIDATTNIGMVTRQPTAQNPTAEALISARKGTVNVSGDITSSNGGALRVEGLDVSLGSFDDVTGAHGGVIDVSGAVQPRLEIGFTEGGVQQTRSVTLNGISTQGRKREEDAPRVAGGNVVINATGDITIHGSINTDGDAGNGSSTAQMPGGSVKIATTGEQITVGSITTRGGLAPAAGQPEPGSVSLSANTVLLNGDIDAHGGNNTATDDGSRDRSIRVDTDRLLLGTTLTSISGGDITLTGLVAPNDPATGGNLTVTSSGATTFGGPIQNLDRLVVASLGGPMTFGGDVLVSESIDLQFRGAGAGEIRSTSPLVMSSHAITLTAAQRGKNDGTSASLSVDGGVSFNLVDRAGDVTNADPLDDILRGTFTFDQDKAIDTTTTAMLFTPNRFTATSPDPNAPTGVVQRQGLVDSIAQLNSHGSVTLDANARAALAGSELVVAGKSFSAPEPDAAFDVSSLAITTRDSLVADFDVTATGARGITLRSDLDGNGDTSTLKGGLQVAGNLFADSISLVAGAGGTGAKGTAVTFDPASARLRAANGTDPAAKISIAQDADLDSAGLPGVDVLGPVAGLDLTLQSLAGSISITSDASVAGSKLTLTSAHDISLGDASSGPLQLASLTASSADSLTVSRAVTTAPGRGSKIQLQGGSDGSGNLTLNAALAADDIALIAGKTDELGSTSRVELGANAGFASATAGTPVRSFLLQQDAPIGSVGGTPVPAVGLFAGGIAGMELGLRSDSSVEISDSANVNDTFLTLSGASVTIKDDLALRSLDVTGPTTLTGANVTATGDVALRGAVTMNAAVQNDPNAAVDQKIDAGGDLTITGKVSKTSVGNITLGAGDALSVASVETARLTSLSKVAYASAIDLHGGNSVKVTGLLNSSATAPARSAGAVTVTSGGAVDVFRINANGSVGTAQSGSTAAGPGSNGGNVTITGSKVKLDQVETSGGNGGGLDTNRTGFTSHGGDAGFILVTATAPDGDISLSRNLLAQGGAGFSTDSTKPSTGQAGAFGDVTLDGDVRLLATGDATQSLINEIRGDDVAIRGEVTPGTRNDPNAPAGSDPIPQIPIPANFTGLKVIADSSLAIDGDITAGKLDLEVHKGDLALKADPTAKTVIHANDIRLAATDGHSDLPTNQLTGKVDLSRFVLAGADGTELITRFALEQDASIGGGGTPIPSLSLFAGAGNRIAPFALSLISQDGSITLGADDVRNVTGSNLLLAANGEPGAPAGVEAIQITGGEPLEVAKLTLGALGNLAPTVGGTTVRGDTHIAGDLEIGNAGTLSTEVLTAVGGLRVDGSARVFGNGNFVGTEKQTLQVTGPLDLRGSMVKTGDGDFDIVSDQIVLAGTNFQSLASNFGKLSISSPLVKAEGTLLLRGVSKSDSDPAITVKGTRGDGLALETLDGDLIVSATFQPDTVGAASGPGTYQLDGGIRAAGDVTTTGRAELVGNQTDYVFEAVRNAAGTRGGELNLGGIASANGDVHLLGEGDLPSVDNPEPVGVRLNGKFDLASNALFVDGVTEVAGDSTIDAGGNVEFLSQIQGANNLDVRSHKQVVFYDDVAMTGGAFSARADKGVRFASAEDREQSIQAGSISLGNGVAAPPAGRGSLLRDGDLRLTALAGNVTVSTGQRLMVNGELDVSGASVILADTAALGIDVRASDFGVYGGTTVVGNRIATTARPRVLGGGTATFAVPTRTEITDNIPSDSVFVRAISDGSPLSFASTGGVFDPIFPTVSGAAIFDYARLIPYQNPRQPITRPYADPVDLAAIVERRPLWAEELLAYLEQRSVESSEASGKLPEAEQLPPVGARPGESIESDDARVRGAAVENAVAVYRDLFRPDLRRDPESGVIDAPSHTAAIKSAFQAPVDVLRRAQSGGTVTGAAVADLLQGDARFAAAHHYRDQLGVLLDLSTRALEPDQQPRFRALVLSGVTPYGITASEFNSLF